MDANAAREALQIGLERLTAYASVFKRREGYYRGVQDLPYAPPGVNAEYEALQRMSVANWLALVMDAPIQRMRAEGFRTGRGAEADKRAWDEVWQPNRLDSRQRIVYAQMVVHGCGLMGVWPDRANRKTPRIRPESIDRVYMHPDPEDPFTTAWAVKRYTVPRPAAPGTLVLPAGVSARGDQEVAVVYDATTWTRFVRGGLSTTGQWEVDKAGVNPLGRVPFVAFSNRQDATGAHQSSIEPLMPAQDAINTIRFQTLLAMQFSAYRQRVFTGYDPVMRTKDGSPIHRVNADGTTLIDAQGQPIPALSSPGRTAVDRALVFPGTDTKVFDLPESNLDNYIKTLVEFLSQVFAVGQVPPQYLLNRMANVAGDAMDGADVTMQSLVADLKMWTGESLEEVMGLANIARGEDEPDLASEVVWADTQARTFAQTVDGIVKLIGVEFPHKAGFEMIPGATPQQVDRWMDLRRDEQAEARENDITALAAAAFRDAPPSPQSDPVPDEEPVAA